jgi:protein O-mannosyl-transferase
MHKNNIQNRDILYLAPLIIVVFAIFFISLNYPFLEGWDDQVYVTKNAHIALNFANIYYWFTHVPPVGGYTPITLFSLMLDYSVWGFNSLGYHLQNVFWHIISVILVFKIFRFFKINTLSAFLFVLIFAIHPQRVESVVWVSERKDVLCATFYFGAILVFLKNINNSKSIIFSFTFFILAILSKPMAYSLPFILVILEFIVTKNISIKHYIKRFWIFSLVLISYGYISFLSESEKIIPADITLFKRIYIALYNFLWYIKTTFLPINLTPMYPRISFSMSGYYVILGYAVLLLIIIFLYLKNKYKTIYTVLPLCLLYAVAFFPVSGILLFGIFDHADRFSYIPSVFIWLIVALLLKSFFSSEENRRKYKRIIFLLLFIYALILSYLTFNYQKAFESLYNLHRYACIYTPANYVTLQKFGDMELEKDNYKEAVVIADRLSALKKTDRLYEFERVSNSVFPVYLKCMSYYYQNQMGKALHIFNKSKENIKSENLPSALHYTRLLSIVANCYYVLGSRDKAIEYINIILHIDSLPKYEHFYYSGVKCTYAGNFESALKFFNAALELKPDDTKASDNIVRINKYLSKNN